MIQMKLLSKNVSHFLFSKYNGETSLWIYAEKVEVEFVTKIAIAQVYNIIKKDFSSFKKQGHFAYFY